MNPLYFVMIVLVIIVLSIGYSIYEQAKVKKSIKNLWPENKSLFRGDNPYVTEILRQYFINHPQSIDKYTFLQNSAFTHWVKEKCSKCVELSAFMSRYMVQ
ncbi:hypothetical protein EDD62_0591 [Abyssicoccus albus]|uniref:Uncharacterized protein n=1 Tax=Abyssicoccus albus TaxID=1817405 RepID=A0A3N5BJD0_9BACL|nr:hypothetical protein EDD62_0591 [Abyssicoccus albus]